MTPGNKIGILIMLTAILIGILAASSVAPLVIIIWVIGAVVLVLSKDEK